MTQKEELKRDLIAREIKERLKPMNKITSVFLGIFLAVFFTACAGVFPPQAASEITRFGWQPITTMMNGDPIISPAHFRIYCDANAPVEAGTGITEYLIKDSLPADAADGMHACTFTAHLNKPCPGMDTGVCESGQSNTLTVWKAAPVFFAGEEPVTGVFRFK